MEHHQSSKKKDSNDESSDDELEIDTGCESNMWSEGYEFLIFRNKA